MAQTGELIIEEARAAVKSVRAEWRERLSIASRLSPGGKLAKKASVLWLDMDVLDDRIAECGGEEEFVFLVCAQVASGVSLKGVCAHYGLQRGLVWAVLTQTEERYERYKRALAGVADEYVGEVVGLADGSSAEDVAVGKLQIDTRLKVAQMYDATRFGRQTKVTHEVVGDFGERLRRAQERVVKGDDVEDIEPVVPVLPEPVEPDPEKAGALEVDGDEEAAYI